MTERGIDQILPHPSDPVLYEPYIRDARQYVELAEQMNGRIPRSVEFSYIWGDALECVDKLRPDLRLINLETSITESRDYWKGKGINFKGLHFPLRFMTVENRTGAVTLHRSTRKKTSGG
jgi:poly-gamma-glutamate synthesis protein (capsule biosynthesis protein)